MAVLATAIWRVRPSGSNTNGGGYDPGIAGAATDYSQQNAAQATGTVGTAAGTTTFTDAGGAFTAAMVGNVLFIASGAGFTAGPYFIVTFNSTTSVVLDRSPGTGSAAQWKVGGGWADFWTNTTSALSYLVPGNTVYILGTGTPNPASYTYNYSPPGSFISKAGDATNGFIIYANDPGTPGYLAPPNTTGGMPTIRTNGTTFTTVFNTQQYLKLAGLWFVLQSSPNLSGFVNANAPYIIQGCVFDQFGFDSVCLSAFGMTGYWTEILGCEFFSSVSAAAGVKPAIDDTGSVNGGWHIVGCNIHDTIGHGVGLGTAGICESSIIAKCGGFGVRMGQASPTSGAKILNCIIDANGGHGIEIVSQAILAQVTAMNNIISNHVTAGKFGLTVDAGTTTQNNRVAQFIDYNTYYNNTTDTNAIGYGPHDTHGGANPYVGQSTENYTPA